MEHRVPGDPRMSDILIPSHELQIDKSGDGLLGRGGYGFVYSGLYKKNKVAVKMLSDDGDIPKAQRNDLKKEARRLRAACVHPYILDLIGVVMETNNYSLVLEYMHFGTCSSFIKNYIVEIPVRVQFAQQIISAMAWLHSQKPPVKHLDLKAENVLINNYFIAKISDFGLSEWRTVTMAFSKTQPVLNKGARCGTLSHIPPEVFMDINKKGAVEEDVYAFGVTLWEIFSGSAPFASCGDNEILIRGAVLNNQRPDMRKLKENCPREIKDMIQLSWDHNPKFRPTFKDLEEKIGPVYLSIKDTLHKHFKYIRAQIVTLYQENPEEAEHYECTKHWDNPENGLPNGQPGAIQNGSHYEQVRMENELSIEQAGGKESTGNKSFDGQPSVQNGSFDSNSVAENRLSNEQGNAENGLTKPEINGSSNEQASPDGVKGTDIKFPPKIQSPQEQLRNFGPAHVPINETKQKETGNPVQRNMLESTEVGLSGFVSVRHKQYTPGAQLRHPHGPIAQPVSGMIQGDNVTNNDCQGEGRPGEEGDDEETKLKRDPVDELLSNLRIGNPSLFQSLMRNPDALENVASLLRSNEGQLEVQTRPSELELSQPVTTTIQRPSNSCTREVTQQTQLLTQGSTVSVDQMSGQTPNADRHSTKQMTSVQQTTGLGPTASAIRMHLAPDRVQHLAAVSPQSHPSVKQGQPVNDVGSVSAPSVRNPPQQMAGHPVIQNAGPFQSQPRQLFQQPVRGQSGTQNQVPHVPQYIPGSQQNDSYTGSQQTVNNTTFGQHLRTNQAGGIPHQAFVKPLAGVPASSQGPAPFVQPPQPQANQLEQSSRQHQTVSQQTPGSDISGSQRQSCSPVDSHDQLRYDETSGRQDQSQTNQPHTGTTEPSQDRTAQPEASGWQKQPVTIYHRHAGGGTTTITMDPDNELPPNLQIGNKNVMVVNDNTSRRKADKKKKQKCKKSQLTTCTDELSMDHIDMVSVEIGKDWKRLCRQLDMTEADIEQLQFDYYASGLYEIMYQGIQRWIQRNGRAANVKTIAEALWEIDRDDIALRLN